MSREEVNRQVFREEARELLSELEAALLELENTPEDRELIDRVFRAMHTIKGSGAMFGFDDVAHFTHDVETVFDFIRSGKMALNKELVDITFKAKDHIQHLFDCAESGEAVDLEAGRALANALYALAPAELSPKERDKQDQAKAEAAAILAKTAPTTYRIRFKPGEEIFRTGNNPLHLLEELTALGAGRVYAHGEDIPLLDELEPDGNYVWWDVILNTESPEEELRNVFIFVEDSSEIHIDVIDHGGKVGGEEEYKKLGEILIERGDITPADLQKVLSEKKLLGDMLAEAGVVSHEKVAAALTEQRVIKEIREKRPPVAPKPTAEPVSSIRVAADKLDYLVNLVGELVIVQAQISQAVGAAKNPGLTSLSEELERLSAELRDSTLSIRMLPIGSTFNKFRRLVRDLSAELGKEINLITYGEDTELDKTVIERLNDPLVHLLRNSIDHGIESPEDRRAKGKSSAGTIELVAEHSGSDVLIRVKDDGKGLDPVTIRAKGVERGLIDADAQLSDKEIWSLIFLPGFSTAAKVTNVSGRGVGLDVVKKAINDLRGAIDIASTPGQGAVFTVKLPLTLAIIEGLQIEVSEECFVIPLSLVEECVELVNRGPDHSKERIINLRGEIVPYIRLREWFDVPGDSPLIEQIVIVGIHGARVGIVVDRVVGEHQTVIKSLGKIYKNVEGISGATIKGDGGIALIIDVPRLVATAAAAPLVMSN
jgi:two-component system chemotaxis sensor kinase CheA